MARRRDDSTVGYGKPPKHTQFKKGQSGNMKGQRNRRPNKIQTILNEVLGRKIRVVEAGVSRRVTIREVIITQLAAKAVSRLPAKVRMTTMIFVQQTGLGRAQQPGKPKPPGNPQKLPDREVPPPIEEPPEPIPTPPERDDPTPMEV